MNSWQRFWQYVTDCARLLYWTYFKPFTFNHWLKQEIHPDLTFIDSPFQYRQEFVSNPKLQCYADKIVWTTIVTLWLTTLLVAILYTLFSGETFIWSRSTLILCGWSFGVLVVPVIPQKLLQKLQKYLSKEQNVIFDLFLLVVILFSIDLIVDYFESRGAAGPAVVGILFGMLSMMIMGMIPNITIGLAISIAFGMVGMMIGVTVGVAVGWILGIRTKAMKNVIVVMMVFTVIFSVLSDIKAGIAFAIFCLLGVFRLYFWPFEALWMFVLRFRYLPQYADLALRRLPPYFDELIYFPLPFMSQLITEAYRVNSLAARQTLDHFTNFTNQQAVVGTVTVRIALDTLHRCQTEYDIAHVATEQLDWIPDPAPAALGTSLPKCLDLSRDVRSAYEATTPYRHKQLLTKPLNDLIQLRQQLGFKQNSAITTALGQITERWLAILETAHKTLTEQIKQSGELPSGAYIAGSSLDPATADQNFRGRQDLFAEIENVMLATQPPILLLCGNRRSGKTSALKYLPKRTGTALVPLLIDLQQVAEVSTLMGVAESMANQMIDFARTTRNMTLPRYDTDALRQDPFHALRQWFKQIEQTFPDKRFLLCLDEFTRLEEVVTATGSRAPLNFLRATFQHHPCWVVLFAGAHQPTELADYWSDYLINTRTLRLSYLQESEARELIEKPSGDFPEKVYDPAAIEAIVYQTHCQPYLVQLLCQNVIEYLNRDKRRYAQLEDVTAAIPHAIERGGQYFRELWKHTLKNATDREIIRKVLAGQSLLAEETQRIPYLVDKEIIEKTASGYRLQVPLVATALRGYNTASFR